MADRRVAEPVEHRARIGGKVEPCGGGERRNDVAAHQPLGKGGEARVAHRVGDAVVPERQADIGKAAVRAVEDAQLRLFRSEEHTSELQSLMRISYAVFCLKKKK